MIYLGGDMHLPDALPDELLFSRLVRYCKLYAVPISQLLEIIYGDYKASISPIVTSGLSSISNTFHECQDNLMMNQTLSPLFMHCYPTFRERLAKAIFSTDNYTAFRVSHLSWVREREKLTLKVCPTCIKEDLEQFGVDYWHRVHQIPGIESCCYHQVQLNHVDLPKRIKLNVGLPSFHMDYGVQTSSSESFLLAKFAKKILLEQSNHISNFNPDLYREKLGELGFITKAGRIRRVKLLSDFCQFTSQLQYPSTNLLPASVTDYKYITSLLYGHFSQHIFKYLILGYWLSSKQTFNQTSMIKRKQTQKSTHRIKQRCLSLLNMGLSISSISKKTGKSRTYIKLIAYSNGITHHFKPAKLAPLIRSRITHLAWKGFHRFEIARRVSVSTGSVEMLISATNGLVAWRKQCKHESKRRRYRCQILRYIQSNPVSLRKDIKRDCNAAFYWLYNHEREWLEPILPKASCPYRNPRSKDK